MVDRGKTALDFAISAPERVRTLILVEPADHWSLEETDEVGPELQRLIDYLHSLAGKIITEDDLAGFLSKAGFAEDPARGPPGSLLGESPAPIA